MSKTKQDTQRSSIGPQYRILVVGSSCSGKTTLARRLSLELGIHHIQLDVLNWLPNWQERENEDFLDLLSNEIAAHDGWVIDGNYNRTHYLTWPRAQVVVWLNYAYSVVLWRAFSRTLRRVFSKEKLYSDNVETFRKSFLSKDSILLWVITRFHYRRRRYKAIREQDKYSHLHWIELRRPSEVATLTHRIAEVAANKG